MTGGNLLGNHNHHDDNDDDDDIDGIKHGRIGHYGDARWIYIVPLKSGNNSLPPLPPHPYNPI